MPAHPPVSRRYLPLGRRTFLRGGFVGGAALLVSGCDVGGGDDTAGSQASIDSTDADEGVVGDAASAIQDARDANAATAAGVSEVTTVLSTYDGLHERQLEVLAGALGEDSATSPTTSPTSPTSSTSPAATDAATALAAIRASETALADRLAELAVDADSGALARSLASMAAAIDQLLLTPERWRRMSESTDALQTTLAAEHEALWLYGLLVARTSASEQPELSTELSRAYLWHRVARDELSASLYDAGEDPVAAAAAYVPPTPLTTAEEITVAAQSAEQTLSGTWAYLVANTTGDERTRAIARLRECAARVIIFGGAPSDSPGITEA